MSPELIDTLTKHIIEQASKRCSGHVLVIDEYNLRRIITEFLERNK